MKKTIRIALTSILIASLCIGLVPVIAFAADDTYNAVCFGDSSSQGYLLDGYTNKNCGVGDNSSPSSYPMQLKSYIAEETEYDESDIEVKNYTFNGMRSNELYAILQPDLAPIDKYGETHLQKYVSAAYDEGIISTPTIGALSKEFIESIKNADLIVYDLGMANFCEYFIQRMLWLFDDSYFPEYEFEKDNFSDLMKIYEKDVADLFNAMKETLTTALTKYFDDDLASDILSTAMYCYGAFVVYYRQNLELIYRLNPDAQVIVFNMYPNAANGLVLKLGEGPKAIDFEMSVLMIPLFESMNIYLSSDTDFNAKVKIADIADGIETVFDEIAKGKLSDNNLEKLVKGLYELNSGIFGGFTPTQILTMYGNTSTELEETITKNIDKMMDNLLRITMLDSVDVNSALELMENIPEVVSNTVMRYDYATDAERGLTYMWLRYMAPNGVFGTGFGFMPSEKGCTQKFKALKTAYKSQFTANGVIYTRIVNTVSEVSPDLANILAKFFEILSFIQNTFAVKAAAFFKSLTDLVIKLPGLDI